MPLALAAASVHSRATAPVVSLVAATSSASDAGGVTAHTGAAARKPSSWFQRADPGSIIPRGVVGMSTGPLYADAPVVCLMRAGVDSRVGEEVLGTLGG